MEVAEAAGFVGVVEVAEAAGFVGVVEVAEAAGFIGVVEVAEAAGFIGVVEVAEAAGFVGVVEVVGVVDATGVAEVAGIPCIRMVFRSVHSSSWSASEEGIDQSILFSERLRSLVSRTLAWARASTTRVGAIMVFSGISFSSSMLGSSSEVWETAVVVDFSRWSSVKEGASPRDSRG